MSMRSVILSQGTSSFETGGGSGIEIQNIGISKRLAKGWHLQD